METTEKKQYKKYPPVKMHTSCTGCYSSMLEDTFETKESRDLLGKILDRLIKKSE